MRTDTRIGHERCSGAFIVIFELISHIVLVFPLFSERVNASWDRNFYAVFGNILGRSKLLLLWSVNSAVYKLNYFCFEKRMLL